MTIVAQTSIGIIAAIHIYILWLEMFAWNTFAKKAFKKFPPELFEKTQPMAANQGLYNGFLAAGLIWSLFIQDMDWSTNVATFFLGCVLVAGLYGAFTVQRTILFVQAVPALLGLLIIYFKL